MIEKHEFGPIPHGCPNSFERANLEVYGINHYKPSYCAMIFFNDDEVTEDNADDSRASYAGQFSIFGHYRCFGGKGHCHVPTDIRRFDTRPSHPLTKSFKRVDVTDALKKAVKKKKNISITLVVKSEEGDDDDSVSELLDIGGMQLVSF
jgi:tyrosinase